MEAGGPSPGRLTRRSEGSCGLCAHAHPQAKHSPGGKTSPPRAAQPLSLGGPSLAIPTDRQSDRGCWSIPLPQGPPTPTVSVPQAPPQPAQHPGLTSRQ